MKIQNYAVAMSAQYYNLSMSSTEAKISSQEGRFDNGDTQTHDILKIAEKNSADLQNHDELSKKLSKALMQNIHNETRTNKSDRIEISHTYMEAQELHFSLAASVQTKNAQIDLTLDVSLSRSFVEQTKISIDKAANLTDPLVISLDGRMPRLSSHTFAFDIDSDGKDDQISQLMAGNGFLALDKNGNGIVDNGRELFGTKSGNGFADLAKYDADNNGWIDQNDPIFNKLRIWEKNGKEERLIGLGEVGIGAIFLGNITTPFSLKDHTNSLLGELKSSGFALFDNGKAGIVSQLDLNVNNGTQEKIEIFEKLHKQLSEQIAPKLYKNTQASDVEKRESTDEKIEKIMTKIKKLERKLLHAEDMERGSIQAQIGALFAQMMSMLEVK